MKKVINIWTFQSKSTLSFSLITLCKNKSLKLFGLMIVIWYLLCNMVKYIYNFEILHPEIIQAQESTRRKQEEPEYEYYDEDYYYDYPSPCGAGELEVKVY